MLHDFRPVLRYGSGILASVAGFLLLFFAVYSYRSFAALFSIFRKEKRFTGSLYPFGFSEASYQIVIGLLAVLLLASLGFFYWLRRPGTTFATSFAGIFKTLCFPFQKLRQQWLTLPNREKLLFLITGAVLLISRVVMLQMYPVITDEAATYVLFVSKGLQASITYYPLPNNHILYSVLCLPFHYFSDKAFWVLKLPSVLISLALFPVLYLGLRSVFRFPVAFIVAIGCGFSNYAMYYAVHGRGYTLLLFCTVVVSLALLKIVQQKDAAYWFLFMFASIAGFYTIPVFLYPFAAKVLFAAIYLLAVRHFRVFRQLVLACFFVGLITSLLYLPVILVSGSQQLFSNGYVQAIDRQHFFAKLPFYFGYIHGAMLGQETLGKYIWLAGTALLLFLLIFRRRLISVYAATGLQPVVLYWVLCGTVLPFFMLVLHGVMPPERIWLFLVFADFMLLGITFQVAGSLLLKHHQKLLPLVAIGFAVLFTGYQVLKLHREAKAELSESKLVESRLRDVHQFRPRTIFSTCNAYGLNIFYEFVYSGEADYVFHQFNPQPGFKYDVLILGTENPVPEFPDLSQYQLYFEEGRMKIYLHRELLR